MTSAVDLEPVRPTTQRRYGRAAVVLHWLIAALIVAQLCLGWAMNEVMVDHSPPQALTESIHISLGLTLLLLVFVRIGVRLTHRPPPLPAALPGREKLLAHGTHGLLYLLMLAIPLTGWTLVSMGARPIAFWGLPWPHLPGVSEVFGASPPRPVRHQVAHLHVFVLIWVLVVAWAAHVAGALKHQFDGRPVLWRMVPFLKPVRERGGISDRIDPNG